MTLSGSASVAVSGSHNIGSLLSGSGSLVKSGTGSLNLSAANSYTGTTTINGGTLKVTFPGGNNGGVGTFGVGSSITVNSGGTLLGSGVNVLGHSSTHAGDLLTVNVGGVLLVDAGSVLSMPYALNIVGGTIASVDAGDPSLGNIYYASTQGTFTSSGDGTPATISVQKFNLIGAQFNVVRGSGAVDLNVTGNLFNNVLTKNGNGIMTLTGSNTYGGTTAINAGTLQIGAGTDAGSIASTSSVVNNGALVYKVASGARTLAVPVSGTGTLTQNSVGGSLTLTGTNTYTGATTISSGTLQIGSGSDAGSIASTSSVTDNGALVYNVAAGTRTLAAPISGSGSLTQKSVGGSLTLTGTNTYSGVTAISSGTLTLSGNGSINSSLSISGGGTFQLQNTATATFSNFSIGVGAGNNGNINQTGGNLIYTGTGTGNASGFILGYFASAIGIYNLSGGLLSATSGDITLGYDGTGIINQSGGVANINGIRLARGTNPSTGTYNLTSGTLNVGSIGIYKGGAQSTPTLNFGGGTVGALAAWTTNIGITLTGSGGDTTFDTTGGTIGLSGVLSGTGGLIKVGTSTLTLSGTNTYSGTTTINSGTLAIGNANGLGTGPVILSNSTGATLQTGTSNTSPIGLTGIASLTCSGTLSQLTFPSNGTTTLGSITTSGTAALTGCLVNLPNTVTTSGTYTLITAASVTGTANLGTNSTGHAGVTFSNTGTTLKAILP
jgi:autotransporter-associated beta strand protein